ncbi:MAG: hypothetical protein EB060_08445 [Proteobacteria bacterium]|nr:hypothetical protein [Pseudomonadota bacterium]
MWTTIRYILITALRDKLFIGLFAAILIAASIALFLGSTAMVEQQQMTIAYIAGSARVILVVGLIVFICFHVRRAFENREVEVTLTRPISREAYVFCYWLGFSVLSFLVVVPLSLLMALFLKVNMVGLFFWSLSLIAEVLLIGAFALSCGLILQSAVTGVMVSFGFYIISRMMGFFTFMLQQKTATNLTDWYWWTQRILETISMVVPRLDMFAKTEWLIYGMDGSAGVWVWHNVPLFLLQALIYVPLLLFMSIYDFRRRQF